MVHGFIRRPVIFRAVDLSGLQGLINLIKCHRHGNSSRAYTISSIRFDSAVRMRRPVRSSRRVTGLLVV